MDQTGKLVRRVTGGFWVRGTQNLLTVELSMEIHGGVGVPLSYFVEEWGGCSLSHVDIDDALTQINAHPTYKNLPDLVCVDGIVKYSTPIDTVDEIEKLT